MDEVVVDGEEIDADKFDMTLEGLFFADAGYITVKNREFNSPYTLVDLDGGEDLEIDLSMVALGSMTSAALESEKQKTEAELAEGFESVDPKDTARAEGEAATTSLVGVWRPVETKYNDGYVQGAEEIAAREEANLYTYFDFVDKNFVEIVLDNERVTCMVSSSEDANHDWMIFGAVGPWYVDLQDDGSIKVIVSESADIYIRLERGEKPADADKYVKDYSSE